MGANDVTIAGGTITGAVAYDLLFVHQNNTAAA